MTREQWLMLVVENLKGTLPGFSTLGRVRVSCGWPSRRALSNKASRFIGQCWHPEASADKTAEVFISPCISDGVEVAAILVHELVHALVGTQHGHKAPFRKVALAAGLTGKMTATTAGEKLTADLQKLVAKIGPYPHAVLDWENRKKQSTRLVKGVCEECDYTVRITRKWIENAGFPICPSCVVSLTEGL